MLCWPCNKRDLEQLTAWDMAEFECLECISFLDFQTKNSEKDTNKKVKSPAQIIYSVSVGRQGDPNC